MSSTHECTNIDASQLSRAKRGVRYRVYMDQPTTALIMIIAGGLLGFVLGCLILYVIIRAAVSHALSAHRDEMAFSGRQRG